MTNPKSTLLRSSAISLWLVLVCAFTFAQTPGAVYPNTGTYEGSINFPADAGYIDVTAPPYNADKTGATDSTAAINAAINAVYNGSLTFTWQYPIVYFPNGTYLVSGTLARNPVYGSPAVATPDYGMELVGQSMSGVVIKLAPGTFTAAPAMPVIKTQSITGGGFGVGNGTQGFHNIIENLTVTIGTNNAYATGVSYLANNLGAMRNVTVNGDRTATSYGNGIDMTRGAIGPALIENVTVNGFNHGIEVAHTLAGVTLEHVSLIAQTGGALVNTDNVVVANALYTSGIGKAISNFSSGTANNGMIIITGSSLNHSGAASYMVTNQNQSAIVFHSTTFNTAQCFTSPPSCATPSTTADGILVGSPVGTFTWTPSTSAPLLSYTSTPAVVDAPVPAYDPVSSWIAPAAGNSSGDFVNSSNVAFFVGGATGTVIDATAALQSALDNSSGATTFYLPHGVYYISSPLVVPATINRIVGMNSTLQAKPGTTWPAVGQGLIHAAVTGTSPLYGCPDASTCPPLVIERLTFDNGGSIAPYAIDIANDSTDSSYQRDVVLRDIQSGFPASVYRDSTGGRLFMEDVTIGSTTVAGPNLVEARQLNSETTDWNTTTNSQNYAAATPRINNLGSPLWILGLKTEGPVNILNSSGTGPVYNEVLGGMFLTAPGPSSGRDHDVAAGTTCAGAGSGAPLYLPTDTSTPATFITATNSIVEASFAEDVTLVSQTPAQTTAERSYPFYYAHGTSCQPGAGYYPPPHYGTIQRGAGGATGEAGFQIPYLLTP